MTEQELDDDLTVLARIADGGSFGRDLSLQCLAFMLRRVIRVLVHVLRNRLNTPC